MNIKKIEKQLRKINQLFDNIKEDGTVSSIERDLMLSYVRGLYEKIISPQNSSDEPSKKEAPAKVKQEAIKIIEEAPKAEEVVPEVSNHIADVVMQEVVDAEPPHVSNSFSSTSSASKISAPAHEAVAVQEEVVEIPKPQIPEELVNLFKFETNNELSDRLSRSPISDLTKCMGINEKIFTVKELFGGDSALFNRAMESMDKLSSLEEARDYLIEHVAIDQNWGAEGSLKKASKFIKLISRRY